MLEAQPEIPTDLSQGLVFDVHKPVLLADFETISISFRGRLLELDN